MRRMLNTILVLVMLFVAACSDRIDIPLVQGEAYVRLNLTVEPEISFTPVTKGAYVADEATGEDVSIHNLWVLQFGGASADAALREARYIEDYDPDEVLKLIASSVVNRIILIANTFDSNLAFADCDNLGEFMDAFKPIADEADATRLVAGKRCPIMSAYRDMVVSESGTLVTFNLKRCICKANVTIINNTLENSAPDITITSVTICSVPNKLFFYTSYDLPARFPAAASKDRIDYTDMEWTDGTEVDAKTRSFTFYLPVNKCGSVPTVPNPTMRSHYAPAGASYLRVLGTYFDVNTFMQRGVEYRIPLGTSADDCNLLPGGKYTYTLTINDPSDPDADGRVAEDILVDYCQSERANSYIINLPKATGAWKNFRIPVSRVFDFWNPAYGYFPNADNALLPGCNGWKVDILWSEFLLEEEVNFRWVKQTGTDYQDYFEFAVKEGAGEGNFVICLRRFLDAGQTELSDVCMWSWQMWVTDYNPNDAINYIPNVDGSGNEQQFSYPVINGEVHRYNYPAWRTGRFRNGFIMDRNLGNIAAATYVKTAKKGHVYYQHGRKDPLTPLNPTGTQAHPVYNVLEGYTPTRINVTTTGLADNVPYTVNHPTTKLGWSIASTVLWQNDLKYSFGYYWGDLKATKASIKSIFDPCPPGWIVPSSDVVNASVGSSVTTDIVLSDKVTAIIPGAGMIGGWNGPEEYVAWPGQQNCALYYSNMAAYASLKAAGCGGTNTLAFPVRCVTDNIVE